MQEQIRGYALDTLSVELAEASSLVDRVGDGFVGACQAILACRGKVVVTGIGKSGHIGKKIAATLASTGSPAFFVHPAEALHGDLGMISQGDLVLMISNSGEAQEFKTMLPLIKRKTVQVIGFTGRADSFLAKQADFLVDIGARQEACPLGLAPTSSTLNTLMMGDALAIAAMQVRQFDEQDYAVSHPGGSLGARLLLRNSDLLESGAYLPLCPADTPLKEAILILSRGGCGLLLVGAVDAPLVGVFTDGDLRRALERDLPMTTPLAELMTRSPVVAQPDELAAETLARLHQHNITALPVVDERQHPLGLLGIHQIYRAGLR
ncbi:KpsF/GutQ family sugar-phosphate isomerase [Pseudaeromonas sp. ZJS20]|uniref:KpsF/GutQ family sugar-phosphate isomerase n=1 Tax=Pseudaeromonas aegiceratis TaxID=3153928 RepID=UPI00390CCA97